MSHIIGRGRYRGETYPIGAAGGGGAGAAIVPLSRQRFIDGGTAQTGLTGSAAEPFKTIAQFMASRGNASVPDATANYVGWLMPSLNGYAEDVSFPPYASTELRADSFSAIPGTGTIVTGNVAWPNVGGAHAAGAAFVVMHNIVVTGNFTVTDDGGAPASAISFGGDEIGDRSSQIGGNFVASGTSQLAVATFTNALISGNLEAGFTSNSADVVLVHSVCQGDVSAKALEAIDSQFNSSAITVNDSQPAVFTGCEFTPGSNPVLTCLAGATFDGPSWRSFLEAGGTRSVGTIVLVVGGYSGGSAEGATTLPTATGTTNVSLNGTGATAPFTGENSGNHYLSTGLNADGAVIKIKTGGGERSGDTMCITKVDTAAHALTIQNNAGTVIGVIPSGSRGFVLAEFLSAVGDWFFAEGGSLAL